MSHFITLPANAARVAADQAALAALQAKPLAERAASREKEFASGDGDFTRVNLSEGRFIDLAIHKDTFLDDAAIRTDITSEVPVAWKSRYTPTVGVTTGSVYGGGVSTLYATQDNDAFITPFVVEAQSVKVPTMALTQDPIKLGLRDAADLRIAEALRLKMETFLVNIMFGQPLGTDLATSVTNYAAVVAPYLGKTVYVADPGVQSGTYETTNIIDASAEHGLTSVVFELLMVQEMQTGRQIQTLHIPTQGFAFRKLMRAATIVATSSSWSAGAVNNQGLEAIPASEWEKRYKTDFTQALAGGLIIELFGRRYKIKANNALPEGYCIYTTDQPAAEIFNITDRSVSTDLSDAKSPYFVERYEKRMLAIAVPHPWFRNYGVVKIGTTTGL